MSILSILTSIISFVFSIPPTIALLDLTGIIRKDLRYTGCVMNLYTYLLFPATSVVTFFTNTGPEWLSLPMIIISIVYIYMVRTENPGTYWLFRILQTILIIYLWVIFAFTLSNW
ncbi:hypothetical protein ACFL1A_03030 [Patescibacteria group bacterium]